MRKNVKNLLCLILSFSMVLSSAACGNTGSSTEINTKNSTENNAESNTKNNTESNTENNTETGTETASSTPSAESGAETAPSETRTLVVYFSRTGEQYTVGVIDHGNTAIVAEMIAAEIGADLFEVLPEDDHYPMTYAELTDVAKREQNENTRPAYAGDVPDLSRYDTVFIGAPVWWGDWPMIMYTFFEENAAALSGKTLVLFSTHEGSGLSGFDKKLSSAVSGSAVLKGLAIRGNDCQNKQDDVRKSVNSWIAGLGF